MKNAIVFIAPLGAILAAAWASLTTYRVMLEIGGLLKQDHVVALPSGHLIGLAGLCLFGFGMIATTLSNRRPTALTKAQLVLAAVLFGIAFLAILWGNWRLRVAFITLATAESIESTSFLADVAQSYAPLLIGWGAFVLAAIVVALAAYGASGNPKTNPLPVASTIGCLVAVGSCFFLVLAVMWSGVSFQALPEVLNTDTPVEPARLAGKVNGMILSGLLMAMSIAGFGLASLLMVLAKPKAMAEES